jgi:lactate dehydrogenase-like 2-hydroxyacid dehydrogenase
METIGFIGSGGIGAAVARLAVAAGYDVVLSNSRGPQTYVMDAINYIPQRDGAIPGLDDICRYPVARCCSGTWAAHTW